MQEIKLNGWVVEDVIGEQYFYKNEPEEVPNHWYGYGFLLDEKLDLGTDWKKSKRRVINNVVQDPRPDLKVDDPVYVRQGEHCGWEPRYFHSWDEKGLIRTFPEGRTSFSQRNNSFLSWNYYKLP
jgi:hypothetical protein